MSRSQERLTVRSDEASELERTADDVNVCSVDARISPEEAQQLREERLQVIRQAIADGAYDSDTLLEKAFQRLIDRMNDSEDSLAIP